jgi:hypothetical protein
MSKRIAILGGYGSFGSLISEELSHSAAVVVAGRNQRRGQKFADAIGADFSFCDARDNTSLRTVIQGADVVINASGPFLPNDYTIPRTCLEEGCHYIDLADNRDYVMNFHGLHEAAQQSQVFACTGASTAPTVTYALISELQRELTDIQSIRIYLSAGNKNRAGPSTFESILSYAGTPVDIWEDGQWKRMMAWGWTEAFRFPDPVGKRLVQLCDVPDLELFPKLFEAETVSFKAGLELTIFNLGMSALAHLKRQFPQIQLPALARPLIRISDLFKNFGSYAGGVLVKVEDKNRRSKSLALVTSRNGPRVPTAPAVLLTRKILQNGPPRHGAFPCIGFISANELSDYLEPFGIKMVPG